ncbi:arrestin domain-containing protein 3-like [Scomber scombrus]|uniref:arrestin domain-containing protein 3-like n=1 Tax=Scomber scombrus TaxID=13677 RepID=UPI002DD7F535|nr:arrestin domain-containing protein 3-like [Scomber scombrus]
MMCTISMIGPRLKSDVCFRTEPAHCVQFINCIFEEFICNLTPSLTMFGETFKNFNISFAALNERNTLTSGDVITGNISFDLTSETKITSIIMTLTGAANVHWAASKRVNNHRSRGRNRRTQTRHYSAKLDFFNLKNIIALQHSGTDGTAKLPPGTHVYPFACQIPQGNFPSTFHGVHGKIVYSMTVSIDRPWSLSKDFVTELNFVNRINTNQPELQAQTARHCAACGVPQVRSQ